MIIYIAGKMTGLPDMGRGHFNAAEKALKAAGHTVLNPAVLPADLPQTAYMPITLSMLNAAEAIFVLRGWEHSEGAMIEYYFAHYQAKHVYYEELRGDCVALGIRASCQLPVPGCQLNGSGKL